MPRASDPGTEHCKLPTPGYISPRLVIDPQPGCAADSSPRPVSVRGSDLSIEVAWRTQRGPQAVAATSSETHRIPRSAMKTHSAKPFDRCPILPNRHKPGGVGQLDLNPGYSRGSCAGPRLPSKTCFAGLVSGSSFPACSKASGSRSISASLSQPRRHIGASRHFCPATSLHQLLCSCGAFRYGTARCATASGVCRN